MTSLFWAWNVQVALLVAAGAVAAFTLAHPKVRLIFWQALLLTLLVLPVIEPWRGSPILVATPAVSAVVQQFTGTPQPVFHWRAEYWFLLIAAGAALRLIWIALGFLRLRGYRKRATLVAMAGDKIAYPTVRFCVSDCVPGAVTYGWLRPTILLPARVMQLPASMREAIATHELIHVRRCDWLFVLAEEAIRTVLWFHPAVWLVLSRIQLAREQVVDSEVVRLTENRGAYLDALVEVASLRLRPDLAPAPLFLRKRHLAARVAAILKEVSMSRTRIAASLTAVVSTMLLAARVAVWFVPFVSPAQTVTDDPGVTVNAGGTLLHRAPVRRPSGTVTGTVILEATLNSKGEIADAQVLSGPEELRKEALASVLQWHYSPGVSRVQISIRFDPAVSVPAQAPPPPPPPAPPPARTLPGNRIPVAPPPPPPAPPRNASLVSIGFFGFTPEAEQELRNRLAIHEGDYITSADMARISAAVKEFDSHAVASFSGGSIGLSLRISVAPESGPFKIGNGVTAPRVISQVQPAYSEEARKAKWQGTARLSVVIDETGQATNIRVITPLGFGLDEKAIEAVQKWKFQPGTKDGQPVPVQATIEVNFRLLDDPPQQ